MLRHRATIALLFASASAPYAVGQAPSFPRLSPPQAPVTIVDSAPDVLAASPSKFSANSPMADRELAAQESGASAPAGEIDAYAALAAEATALQRMENVVKLVAKIVRPCVVHIEASK